MDDFISDVKHEMKACGSKDFEITHFIDQLHYSMDSWRRFGGEPVVDSVTIGDGEHTWDISFQFPSGKQSTKNMRIRVGESLLTERVNAY